MVQGNTGEKGKEKTYGSSVGGITVPSSWTCHHHLVINSLAKGTTGLPAWIVTKQSCSDMKNVQRNLCNELYHR